MRRLLDILALLPLFLLFLLSACTDDKEVVALLDRAEALMEAAPDSASRLLHAADSAIARQSEPTRMRHAVLLAQANNKLYQPLPSDTTFQEVVDYYDRHGSPNQQLLAHYLLGCIYRDRNEAPQALQCYYDAIEKADTLSPDCDYTTLFSVYGQMGDVLHDQVMPEEEIEALKQYSKWALKAGNVRDYILGIRTMAGAYELLGDTTHILATEEKAHALFLKHNLPEEAAASYNSSIYIHLERGNYRKAKQLMDIFENQSGFFDNKGNIKTRREHYYYAKGLYYQGIHQLDSAEFFFRRLLSHQYFSDGYRGLMHTYMEKGNTDSVLFYAHKYEQSIDTLVTEIHAEATRQALGMYNYSRYQRMAQREAKKSERQTNIIYAICIAAIIIAFSAYLWHQKAVTKRKREVSDLTHLLASVSDQYTKAKEDLDSMGLDYTSFRKRKKEELDKMNVQLKELQSKYNTLKQHEKVEALMQSPIISTAKSNLKSHKPLSTNERKKLVEAFRQSMPTLHAHLSEHKITGELETLVVILSRLNFRVDDMAILLTMSKQSVSNTRAYVNQKLFNDNSASTLFRNMTKI